MYWAPLLGILSSYYMGCKILSDTENELLDDKIEVNVTKDQDKMETNTVELNSEKNNAKLNSEDDSDSEVFNVVFILHNRMNQLKRILESTKIPKIVVLPIR